MPGLSEGLLLLQFNQRRESRQEFGQRFQVHLANELRLAHLPIEVAHLVHQCHTGHGRILLRPSGTEPVVRVMVEAEDALLAKTGAEAIAAAVAG